MRIKEFYQNGNETENTYENDIQFLTEDAKSTPVFTVAVICTLAGIGLVYIACIYYHNYDTCTYFYATLSAILFITAIICFLIYKNILTQRNRYFKEYLLFRDLSIAIDIAETLPDNDLNEETQLKNENSQNNGASKILIKRVSAKTRVKEQIIQTLLNLYSN